MPELPEVETTRRGLAPALEGVRLTEVDVRRDRMARRNERPGDVVDRLTGRRILELNRHGKFIIGDVESDLTLVIHLGMSGRMEIARPTDPEQPHTNVVFRTERNEEIRFVDPRTFGFVAAFTPEEYAASTLKALGRDALIDLPRSNWLVRAMGGRTIAVKALLLDQTFLAGLGNIYADEVLFRARIHPARPASSLSLSEVKRLRGAIRPVLEAGLRYGGTSLDDLAYLLPDGRAGEYLDRLRVYGREGEPCRRCGAPVERVVIAARSSHYCPQCQRR